MASPFSHSRTSNVKFMNTFFYYIDHITLAASVFLALYYTFRFAFRGSVGLPGLLLFLWLFGACAIVLHMNSHLIEVTYNGFKRAAEGTFTFDFRFYSLLFMGAVFLSIGIYLLECIRTFALGDRRAKKQFLRAALAISALSAPAGVLTPIALLPTLACVISLTGMAFVGRVRKRRRAFHLHETETIAI